MKPRVLLVDDDREFIDDVLFHLADRFEWLHLTSGEQVLKTIAENLPDVVLLDIEFEGKPVGLEVLSAIRDEAPRVPTIMVTRHDARDMATEAWRRGAFGYIEKACPVEQLAAQIERAVEEATAHRERQVLREQLREKGGRLVGESMAMVNLKDQIRRVAETDSTALITGPTGSGKELIAREIHDQSRRREQPFIAVSCKEVPEHLLESDLFGHEKGAFTGACARKIGRFELADRGTIFLDEIGEIPPSVQVKLLRALQKTDGEGAERILVQRVGGTKDILVDVRVIVATNRNLESAVANGLFRDDLYYRIKVVHLHAPPLKDRKEDIPLLAQHLLDRLAREMTRPRCRLSSHALTRLIAWDWPGNVRELRNVLENALVYATSEVLDEDLFATRVSPEMLTLSYKQALRQMIDKWTKDFIGLTLRLCSWNLAEAARRLGISREGLRKMMKRYGISRPGSGEDATS